MHMHRGAVLSACVCAGRVPALAPTARAHTRTHTRACRIKRGSAIEEGGAHVLGGTRRRKGYAEERCMARPRPTTALGIDRSQAIERMTWRADGLPSRPPPPPPNGPSRFATPRAHAVCSRRASVRRANATCSRRGRLRTSVCAVGCHALKAFVAASVCLGLRYGSAVRTTVKVRRGMAASWALRVLQHAILHWQAMQHACCQTFMHACMYACVQPHHHTLSAPPSITNMRQHVDSKSVSSSRAIRNRIS
eukprot:126986-Chlamydomonas_euryale.AAC.7